MNESLQTTLADAVELLRRQGLNFALIGGLAASLRGPPRVTVDVHLVVSADVDRALALVGALDQTCSRPLVAGVETIVQTAFILPLRHSTAGVKVDLSLGLSGFEQQLIGRAEELPLAGVRVPVATAEDLMIMKALAGRPQDEQDIQGIAEAQGDAFDWQYCLQVAADLGAAVGQDLQRRVRDVKRQHEGEA